MTLARKTTFSLKLILSLLAIHLLTFNVLFAQVNKPVKTEEEFLKKNGKKLAAERKQNKQKLLNLAKQKGWSTFVVSTEGRIQLLVGVDELGLPIYDATDNETAAGTTRVNKLRTGGGLGINLTGSGIPINKVALWDGGAVLTNHVEFATGRVVIKDGTVATSSHSTHVAGTIAASGVYAAAKGMASALPNLLSFDFDNDNSEMSTYASGLLLSNHSYGSVAGWNQNSSQGNRWEFSGAFGANEDYKFGYYDSKASQWDLICYNAPYYLPIKSAGNYRNNNGPAVGGAYYRYNAGGTMASAGNRPSGISSNDSYGIVSTYGTAKNIITVGAVNGLAYGSSAASDVVMSSFSAWGPTDDGRIKPDLVADGVNLNSTTDTGPNNYTTMSGTSMSSPNATGSLVLLQELYNQKNNAYMRSATLKGLVLGTTSEAGPATGPDYQFGWGLLNAEKAAKAILNNGVSSLISERTLAQSETQTINVVASGNGPLVATICWTDPAATAVSTASALNNTTLRLVNDLDMRASDGNTTFAPWVLDPANPANAATTGDNFRDNVEQIYIENATPGKTYTFTINHKNTLTNGSQAFSIVVTGVGGTAYCASAPNSNADSKITNFTFSNINNTPATTCTTYSDFTSQTASVEKGKTYNLSLDLGTCGANFDKIAKVFIDWNGDGDFDDAGENVATSGVINAVGTYSTTVVVPNTVTADNYSLIRVVLIETTDAIAVLACGTYAKGETQDYRIKFLAPGLNAGVTKIEDPLAPACANATQTVTVRLKNNGSQSISNIPVTVTVKESGNTVATLNGTYNATLTASGESTFILPGSFDAQVGKTYLITAKTNLVGDLDATDDEITTSIQVAAAPAIAASTAYFCTSTNAYSLSSSGDGTIYWYKDANDVVPFAFGNTASTTIAPTSNNSYYAGLNDLSAIVGPATKYVTGSGAGSYGQATYDIYVTTLAPVVLESARLYVGYPGTITFSVKNSAGIEVSTSTISVNATRTPASTSTSATNDVTDAGQVYALNLTFPSAGNYSISATFKGATLFRSNGGSNSLPYPYTSPLNIFSLTGHNGSSTAMASFYYFFYGMKIKALGCVAPTKLQVPVSNAAITQNGPVLNSNFTSGNQWYFNGNIINGATLANYTPTQTGTYSVKVAVGGGCELTSANYNFDLTSLPVNLLYFTAGKANNGVSLRWFTTSETNNNRFELERSGDTQAKTKIGTVTAKGTAGSYTFFDKAPIIGNNYYLLKQLDNDEKPTLYGPINVKFDLEDKDYKLGLHPNPVTEFFILNHKGLTPTAQYDVNVISTIGQKVIAIKVKGEELINGYKINIPSIAAGSYIVEIRETTSGKNVGWSKMIKL